MKKSRVLTLGLACFFTAVTAFSALATLGGGGALYSHLNDASQSETTLSQEFFQTDANNAQNEALNLDPETDEIIYTTSDGLEIKSHNIVASGTYTSLQYFTLGSYNGTPVNWIILAFNPNGFLTDSTPAGTAIKNDTSKQIMMAQSNTSLGTNQLLCISQYAFNQTTMTITVSAHAGSSYTWEDIFYNEVSQVTQYTDSISDFYVSAPTFSLSNSTIISNCLTLGTTLGLNNLYGSKIVANTSFNNNYVFNFSASQYTTFLNSTGYKVPYLFTATSTKTNLFHTTSATMTNTITSQLSCDYGGSFWKPTSATGTGKATTTVPIINTSGVSSNYTMATYTCTATNGEGHWSSGHKCYYYPATISYSVSTSNLTAAYRPAFVLQL